MAIRYKVVRNNIKSLFTQSKYSLCYEKGKALEEVISNCCKIVGRPGVYDSYGVQAYANAIRILNHCNLVRIVLDGGGRYVQAVSTRYKE